MSTTPFISFITEAPLEVTHEQDCQVDFEVVAMAEGPGKVKLTVHAEETDCRFRKEDGSLTDVIEADFEARIDNFFTGIEVKVPFIAVTQNPSDEAILLTFSAIAVNADGGESQPTPPFNVNFHSKPKAPQV